MSSGDDELLERAMRIQVDVTLNHTAQQVWGHEQRLYLRKRAGESRRHVAMKLLSWLYWYMPGLEIERSVGQHYKPDLVALGADGRPIVWVDCGTTKRTKIGRMIAANPDCRFGIVKPTHGAIRRFASLASPRLPTKASVEWVSFGDAFALELAQRLGRRHALTATVDARRLWLSMDGEDDVVDALHVAVGGR